tara:strand:+ start:471 stop:863 length:393 start_codon:yes stop_codon:yes gene_type:complete
MNKSDILGAFNNHICDFFNDVSIIFPDNNDIKLALTSLSTVRKMNPRLVISIWKEYIVDKYRSAIEAGNMDFFLDKNYTADVKDLGQAASILQKIDTLREPVREMGEDNLNKTREYMKNLTKICDLYYKS